MHQPLKKLKNYFLAGSPRSRFWPCAKGAGQGPRPKFTKGFTLMETLIALVILSVAITGPLALVQRAINASTFAQGQVVASFLAQGVIEYVRNLRDNNDLQGNFWLDNESGGQLTSCTKDIPCGLGDLVSVGNPVATCDTFGPTGCLLKFNADENSSSYGVYGYQSGWQNTNITRKFWVEAIGSDEAVITVEVTWKASGTITNSVVTRDHLFRWRQ